MHRAIALASLVLSASVVLAADKDVSVTIYSSADPAGFDPRQVIDEARQQSNSSQQIVQLVPGFAVVRDTRTLDLKQGANSVAFVDVARFIDPTTVSLVDLSAPANAAENARVQVLEQKFQFDLVDQQKLMEKYLDKTITVNDVNGGAVTGRLLASQENSLSLQTNDGVRVIQLGQERTSIQLGQLPGGLITRPTLRWEVISPADGARKIQTAYQTDAITWRADYNLVLSGQETQADLGAWVSILNLSGSTYENATLKLIAGDVQRVRPPQAMPYGMGGGARMDMRAAAPQGFEEKAFFEYHMYSLPRRTTIDQNSTQQLALFETKHGVKVEKVYVYYGLPEQARHWTFPTPQVDRNLGNQSNKKVDVYLRFENTQANQLGVPLPHGKVRVYKADAAQEGAPAPLEFVGEDLIDHTARNEKVLVKVGQAFDITGERTQTDFRIDERAHWIQESYQIELRNAKPEPVKVIVRENLFRWTNWELTQSSMPSEKVDARTVHFTVEVPAAQGDQSGKTVVTYTAKYTW